MNLPIEALRANFERSLQRNPRQVLTAPTGSGKSTRVPIWCIEKNLRTLVIEPRRLACRSLARYVAKGTRKPLGDEVGYVVRHEKRFNDNTRLVYATPGTALRMIQDSRGDTLKGWDALIIDEFHERHIDTDLLLGLAQQTNFAPQHLIIMSATLQAQRVARWLNADLLEGQGRTFPISLVHHDLPTQPTERDLEQRLLQAVKEALEYEGDILVFLPGKGEIASCGNALRALAQQHDLDILPLHGDLKPDQQDLIFSQEGPRRVILSTNVAETSVTVPRVGIVIDSGLVRQTRYHYGRAVLRLVPIAEDAAEQRKGRAGRVRDGHCIRLWSRGASLEPTTRPEILREPLIEATLTAANCGASLADLPWLDPPPDYALDSAQKSLQGLGCLDEAGKITDAGRRSAKLPLEARQARVLDLAAQMVHKKQAPETLLHDVADLLGALSASKNIWERNTGEPSEERQQWQKPGCDATALILAIRHGKPHRDGLRAWALQEARRVAKQLRRSLKLGPAPKEPVVDRVALAQAWIRADPQSAYIKRKRSRAFGGSGAEVQPSRESLLHEEAEALIAIQTHTMRDRKGIVVHLVTCALPTKTRLLLREGLGEETLVRVTHAKGRTLRCEVQLQWGGRSLETREIVPEGELAREALRSAIKDGRVFRKQVIETRARMARWNLYRKMKNIQGVGESAEQWLEDRVEALGFSHGEELALLSGEDFLWPWPKEFFEVERHWLDRNYPLEIKVHNTVYAVSYQVSRRTVTLETQGRGKHKPPALNLLPAWSGWRIQHRRASNVTVLRR